MNLKLMSVPAPDIAFPWKAEMIRCPELFPLGVMDIVLLSGPAVSNCGVAGCTTVGS